MQPIDHPSLQNRLDGYVGRKLYLHLETTQGAYTKGGFSAFARNLEVRPERVRIIGPSPFRIGIQLEHGWIYADGLTHWEMDEQGRLLLAGHDEEGRLTVAVELSPAPFPIGEAVQPGRHQGAGTIPESSSDSAGCGPGTSAPDPVPLDPLAGERHLLVVLAHPDDESFGCAGRIALLTRSGIPVTCVSATSGQMGRNMGNPPFATRESLPALREAEYREALQILGVDDIRLLRLWDKTVAFVDPEALADRVEAVLREIRPSTVITFHPEYGGHPDHNATAAATIRAVRRLAPQERPRVHCLFVGISDVQPALPSVTVDIAEVSAVKERAFRAHRSQTQGFENREPRDERMKELFERLFREERFWVYPV